MRRSRLSFMLVLFVLTAGCKDLGEPSTDDMVNYRGTIVQESSQSYLIKTDIAFENHMNTFCPLDLPDTFKRGGLRVRFSGKIEAAPNAYYIYPPIRLSRMELIEQ
jgi:hypothetical protein